MISRRIYITIMILFITVFALFMFVGISSNVFNDSVTNTRVTDNVNIGHSDILSSDLLNMDMVSNVNYIDGKQYVAIISSDEDGIATSLLIEWCVYQKYYYKIFTYLPEAEEIVDFGLLVFGDIYLTKEDDKLLYAYADMDKIMVFTKLPDYQLLESNKQLADFFGIDTLVSYEIIADGIKIFPDFMIGGERIYQKDDYFGSKDDTDISVPYYKLSAGYEVYSVGILNNQRELGIEDKDLPPLLWRTRTKNSFVFVVNCDMFSGLPLVGVMTGFMTHSDECYLYPVVNAQTISLVNFPYLSDENEVAIRQIYSRGSDALARDILWPNIIKILKNYGESFNFFVGSQLDYLDEIESNSNNINFYLREINKLPATMGLSFGQVSGAELNDIIDKNNEFFKKHLPGYDFTALYLADFKTDDIKGKLRQDLLNNISMVMSDYEKGDKLIDFVDNNVLSVKFNLDGYQHETWEDIQMKTTYNALGMSNMRVEIKRVIFPENKSDEWNKLSLIWSRGNTYYKDYSKFDMVSIYEMEDRVRRFLALDFIYEYNKNDVNIKIENFDEEAYFILSVYDKSISLIDNGEAKSISNHTYLIKATAPELRIILKDNSLLNKPKNNKTIPSDPNAR